MRSIVAIVFVGLIAILGVVLLLAIAFGDDEDTDANDVALGYVWGSINQNVSLERLRELMTEELSRQTSDQELIDSVRCFPTGVLDVVIDQEIERSAESATITATYRLSNPLQGGGNPQTVERVWQFERVEDGWLLSDLPSCTYSEP